MATEESIVEAVTSHEGGRTYARVIAGRLRYNVSQEERDLCRRAIVTALRDGWTGKDGEHRMPGPRTRVMLAKALGEMNTSDMRDQHHLEGSKVQVNADFSARDLLATLRSRVGIVVEQDGAEAQEPAALTSSGENPQEIDAAPTAEPVPVCGRCGETLCKCDDGG